MPIYNKTEIDRQIAATGFEVNTPEYWFLTQTEYKNKNNQNASTTLEWSITNKVEVFVDGKEYFDDLYNKLNTLMSSGNATREVLFAGFAINLNARIFNRADNTQASLTNTVTLGNCIQSLKNSMVGMRGLTWGLLSSNEDFVNALNEGRTSDNFIAFLDDRLPNIISGHHQKFIIINNGGTLVSYLGGIDLDEAKWDTKAHYSGQAAIQTQTPWHDIHCRLEGPASNKVFLNFKERYNDAAENIASTSLRFTPAESSLFKPWPRLSAGNLIPQAENSFSSSPDPSWTHAVQILRTIPCEFKPEGVGLPKRHYGFSPSGDFSVKYGLEKAINQAHYYIYIEDQYFWSSYLTSALQAALVRGVKIIVVTAREEEMNIEGLAKLFHRLTKNFLYDLSRNPITPNDPSDNFSLSNLFIYHLEKSDSEDKIFVHSKLMIIDDCFVAIGSANLNNRSQTNDSELHASIVDTNPVVITGPIGDAQNVTKCRFALDLRIKLWKEHLNISDETLLNNPINNQGNPSEFPTGFNKIHHVRPYSPIAEPYWENLHEFPNVFGFKLDPVSCVNP